MKKKTKKILIELGILVILFFVGVFSIEYLHRSPFGSFELTETTLWYERLQILVFTWIGWILNSLYRWIK